MKFKSIKKMTGLGNYHVTTPWRDLKESINRWTEIFNLQLNPDFQRGHVWTKEQRRKYVEFKLRGGGVLNDAILFNHPGWQRDFEGDFMLVDGLQRLTSAMMFLNDEIKVFGSSFNEGYEFSEFEDKLDWNVCFDFYVNNLSTRAEVLNWYIELNSGGVVHSTEEIERVKNLLLAELKENKA
jgi:hypothetical protein